MEAGKIQSKGFATKMTKVYPHLCILFQYRMSSQVKEMPLQLILKPALVLTLTNRALVKNPLMVVSLTKRKYVAVPGFLS